MHHWNLFDRGMPNQLERDQLERDNNKMSIVEHVEEQNNILEQITLLEEKQVSGGFCFAVIVPLFYL